MGRFPKDGVEFLGAAARDGEAGQRFNLYSRVFEHAGMQGLQGSLVPFHQVGVGLSHYENSFFLVYIVANGIQNESHTQADEEEGGLIRFSQGFCGELSHGVIAAVKKAGGNLLTIFQKEMEAVSLPEFQCGAFG